MATNTEPTEQAQMERAQSTAHGRAPKDMAQLKAVGSRLAGEASSPGNVLQVLE